MGQDTNIKYLSLQNRVSCFSKAGSTFATKQNCILQLSQGSELDVTSGSSTKPG